MAMDEPNLQEDLIPSFRALGNRLERSWLHYNYDEEVFSRLALESLEDSASLKAMGVGGIIDWFFGREHAFQQPSARKLFGQPPIMLFQAPRFYIEALFWFSGTTSIHEHGFSGAFSVLAGSSVHSHWHFELERAINSRMLCGRLDRVSTEILTPGAIRPIRPGASLIHQLFHLEVPSVTIVVRTYFNRNNLPQYQYLPPGLAVDPEDYDPVRARRLMLLDAMSQGQIEGLDKYCQRLIATSDVENLYYIFSLLIRRKLERGFLEDLYSAAYARHGDVVRLIWKVCAWERRTRIVTSLRSKVSDPDARFLLALLMLMPNRNSVFETINLQFPEMVPLDVIESWLEKLSGKETLGFDFNDTNRILLRGLIEGLDMEDLLGRLLKEFQDGSIVENRDRLIEHVKQLARSDLLFPLLSESPLREEARAA